ncbi:hypothetical protein ACG0Z6_09560 [Roseateles sp. BYS180W]|uniref:J domain-containing protein n=1 Tax=Roseateles rivi TaxID=3299028 RepID=A0ABW7FVZ2_9BURK
MSFDALAPVVDTRRREALMLLWSSVQAQELACATLHRRLQDLAQRARTLLEPLHLELHMLEQQLHCALQYLHTASQGPASAAPTAPPPHEQPWLLPAYPAGALDARLILQEPEVAPPASLKTLYRRAARRYHPDLSPDEASRPGLEQQMAQINLAYARGDRRYLEALLMAATDPAARPTSGSASAHTQWLQRCEQAARLRHQELHAFQAELCSHPLHALLCPANTAPDADPLKAHAEQLRRHMAQRRRELYIGQRVKPQSELAAAFLTQLPRAPSAPALSS